MRRGDGRNAQVLGHHREAVFLGNIAKVDQQFAEFLPGLRLAD